MPCKMREKRLIALCIFTLIDIKWLLHAFNLNESLSFLFNHWLVLPFITMHSELFGKVVVASKVPLPNYRPDLDDKRPQREVITWVGPVGRELQLIPGWCHARKIILLHSIVTGGDSTKLAKEGWGFVAGIPW